MWIKLTNDNIKNKVGYYIKFRIDSDELALRKIQNIIGTTLIINFPKLDNKINVNTNNIQIDIKGFLS